MGPIGEPGASSADNEKGGTMKKSWRCRIGWHSYAIRRNAESGDSPQIYLECRRCMKEKDVTRSIGNNMIPNG